jgi:hypothetical protein
MIDGQSMEVEAPVLVPQQAVSPPAAALSKKTLASDAASTPKRRVASKREPADVPASAGGVEKFAQLVKVRSPFHYSIILSSS